MRTRSRATRWLAVGLAAGVLAAGAGAAAAPRAAAPVVLQESGSTLLYPLFNEWQAAFSRLHPGIRVTTAATGSGTGINDAVSGLVQIGASDAYMSDALVRLHPGVLNIALAISSQLVQYNLPGLAKVHLRLSGPVLAGIYQGTIRYWDAPAIRRLNPGVRLPHRPIVPVHRQDGSGDTFLFTQYLSDSDPAWAKAVGYGTTVAWPALPTAEAAVGNSGVVEMLKDTPGSIGYVGISYMDEAVRAGLGYAALENRAGAFVLPTPATIEAAVAASAAHIPADERASLIFGPGKDAYPILNLEYAIVNRQQPNARVAAALRELLGWIVDPRGGNAPRFLNTVHFLPLPHAVEVLSIKQIDEIR